MKNQPHFRLSIKVLGKGRDQRTGTVRLLPRGRLRAEWTSEQAPGRPDVLSPSPRPLPGAAHPDNCHLKSVIAQQVN